jgi:drug/metabolite transporter (DMT)-like permease
MQIGNLSIIMPFGYTKIIFAGFFGAILFREYPLINHYIGYALIITSSCYLTHFRNINQK